jgi:hypothetical protein
MQAMGTNVDLQSKKLRCLRAAQVAVPTALP